MRKFVLLLAALGVAAGAGPAGAAGFDGALGILVFRPLSSELNSTYAFGPGLAADFGLVYSAHFRLSVQVSPQMSWGTPEAGSLASAPEGTLLFVPAHGVVEYAQPVGTFQAYGGLGAGVLYARESKSFMGPLGEEQRTATATRFSWTVMAGLEKGKRTRAFLEAYYQGAGTSGIEGQSGSGVSLATLQLRVGCRTRLK